MKSAGNRGVVQSRLQVQGFCLILAFFLAPIIPRMGFYGLKHKAFSIIQDTLIYVKNPTTFSFMDMFPQTTKQRKRLWIYSLARKNSKDIQPIVSSHVEAVILLSRETDPRTVEVGMEAETGEGKRVNYTGKA